MRRSRQYDARAVEILSSAEPASGTWQWQNVPIKGIEYRYQVTDHNFRAYNAWEFLIRVPTNGEQVLVCPTKYPSKKAFAGLERRSVVFAPCTKEPYHGDLYCKIHLADPTGTKNWIGVRYEDRASLPAWFSLFRLRLHRKSDVSTTNGTDWNSLVCRVRGDDHERMVRLYFALRVWILQERFILEPA